MNRENIAGFMSSGPMDCIITVRLRTRRSSARSAISD